MTITGYRYMLMAAFCGLSSFVYAPSLYADDPDDFMRQLEAEYDAFKKEKEQEYTSFRDKVNAEYVKAMQEPWKLTKSKGIVAPPPVPSPKPDVTPDNHVAPKPAPRPLQIEKEMPLPAPSPQPRPIEQIPVTPLPSADRLDFMLYGTPMSVERPKESVFRLGGSGKNDFAKGWRNLSRPEWNGLVSSCLAMRDKYRLPDWAYLRMLDKVAALVSSENSNEHTMLTGFLFNQSGYDCRFAHDSRGRLHLLFAATGVIFKRPQFTLSGKQYYDYTDTADPGAVYTCDFSTPGELPLRTELLTLPVLALDEAPEARKISVHGHPDMPLSVAVNRNLLSFYNDYIDASPDQNKDNRWAARANTEASPQMQTQLYPALRNAVKGLSQVDAVALLLNVAQSFPYGYDDKIWGDDRIFWPDESWYYPQSDCEDHALHFTRLVRDILDLDCCLIYYPGHISACVAITEGEPQGNYFTYKRRPYTVCDPTYFYGGVGEAAPSNVGQSGILIPLRK